jgi:hypothetical protein
VATTAQTKAEQQRRRVAAVAAGGALASTVGMQTEVPDIPAPEARRTVVSQIIAALVAFLTAKRKRDEEFLRAELSKRGPVDDIQAVIDEEMAREDEFAKRAAARFTRDMSTAVAVPDPRQREAIMRGLLNRESVYARQRSEAMFARAIAAVERKLTRQQSPSGAFWKLDPDVVEHTAGCLIMGGKFWPWAVLDRVHPPRHGGCPCRLVSYGQAIAEGLMRPGDVLNVRDAIRAAAHVMMEGADADRLLAELDMRDALVEAGLASADVLARIPLGTVEVVDGSSD